MDSSKPILTFVVPVYNVDKYLDECLSSLLHQTRMEHKVVIVNDGSTDTSGEIAQAYAAQYPDVFTYVYQENQGLGAARNTGLSQVETPYVTFLDSDDWQDCHFIENLENELLRHEDPIDIIFSLPWVYDSATHEMSEWKDKALLDQLFYPNGGYETVTSVVMTKANPAWMRMYALEASCCRRVFRMDFLKEIDYKFSVGVKWEDVAPHFRAIHYAKRCVAMRGSGFFYRVNHSTQITSGGGASRLDIAPVFSNALHTAISEGWADGEIAHIIHTFWDFSTWSISVTNLDYIDPVLKSIHELFREIPKRYLKVYQNTCCRGKKDLLAIMILRSPMYVLFRDYRTRQAMWRVVDRIKSMKRLFRRQK